MPDFKLVTHAAKSLLFEGRFPSLRACLETAVASGFDLAGVDLRRANLVNASLDGARMPGANLTGANLTGANLSDAAMDDADLSEAALYNACLADSSLRGCLFRHAGFGATCIAGADIGGCVFAGLGALALDFSSATFSQAAMFEAPDGARLAMNRPPVVVSGLGYPLSIFESAAVIGAETFSLEGRGPDNDLPKAALFNTARKLLGYP